MAYKTYITDAIVCGSEEHRMSDRSYLLFTREAGMILAVAKSVREERSKQRFALQEFSRVRAALVRGRDVWRVTGVEPMGNYYFTASGRDTRAIVRSLIQLLRRVIHGETPHADIFDDISLFLNRADHFNNDALLAACTLRILHKLGYIAPLGALSFICSDIVSDDMIEAIVRSATANLSDSQAAINNALTYSHL